MNNDLIESAEYARHHPVEFRFDDWSRLHVADPEGFDARRKETLQRTIDEAPEEVRPCMQAALDAWEAQAATLTDPVERARAALRLAGESFDQMMRAIHRAAVFVS